MREPKVKSLIVCGVEGSGHHALTALLRSVKPDLFSVHVDGKNHGDPPLSDVLLARVAEENKAWRQIFEISPSVTRLVGLPGGLTLATRAKGNASSPLSATAPEGVGFLSAGQRAGGDARDPHKIEVIDASIPFLKGINRTHLNHLDYFSIGESLSPHDTRVIFLTRDPAAVSYSIFSRGICSSLLMACRSTEVSMAIFQQALQPLSKFESLELRYETLLSEPARMARTIERFLFLEEGTLDEGVIKRSAHELDWNEKALLTEFWDIRPKMTLLT